MAVVSCARTRLDSTVYRLPWATSDGGIELQDVTVETLDDPEHFSGSSAQIYVEPGDGGSSLAGAQPAGRFVRNDAGVLIPADYVTMQAVTAYAHVEKLRAFDQTMGAGSVLSWPLRLGVEVRLMSYGQQSSNNAVYDAKLDSLLIVPYDQGGLPLALNGGVLAHEHFHFLFQKLVMSHVRETATQTSCVGAVPPEDDSAEGSPKLSMAGSDSEQVLEKTARGIPSRVFNMYLLRGMNEGFADFYGWLYSGDDQFLSHSLPDQDQMRRLDSAPGRLPSESLVRRLLVDNFHPERILPENVRAHNAYSLGSIYARYLRQTVAQLVEGGHSLSEARSLVGNALIATLPELGEWMSTGYDSQFLSTNFVLSRLMARLPTLSRETCVSMEDVRAPEASFKKPASCDVFAVPEKPVIDPATALSGDRAKRGSK